MIRRVTFTKEGLETIKEDINKGILDYVSKYNNLTQQVIMLLANQNKPFKLYNLGAGVKRITSQTDTCPCCKRRFK